MARSPPGWGDDITGGSGTCVESGGRFITARSISAALLQRCSIAGARAFITTCSKAGEMSGRRVRTGGKEKMPGLLLAASWWVNKGISYTRNVGVIKFQKQFGLALKPLHSLSTVNILLEIVQHFFDCAWFIIKSNIDGTIYCSHTASSNGLLDFIAPRRQ